MRCLRPARPPKLGCGPGRARGRGPGLRRRRQRPPPAPARPLPDPDLGGRAHSRLSPNYNRPTTSRPAGPSGGPTPTPPGGPSSRLAGRDRLGAPRRRPPRRRPRHPDGRVRLRPHDVRQRAEPGGLHYAYHRLVCGDWWDEDPYRASTTASCTCPCGTTPPFAAVVGGALDRDERRYPYLAVIDFNDDPTISGPARARLRDLPARLGGRPRPRDA